MKIKNLYILILILLAFNINARINISPDILELRESAAITDTLLDQYYCIDGNATTEFNYEQADGSTIYQWQSNDGSGFTNLTNNVNFSGVNTYTLTISTIDLSYDGLAIRCIYSISGITDTSNIAHLWVRMPFISETTDSMCLGGFYNWRDSNYVASGTFYDTLTAISGCDSIYKLNLSTYNIYIEDTAIICEGDSALLGGVYQNTYGTYYDTLDNAENVCDTIMQVLLIVQYSSVFDNITICEGDSALLGNNWETEEGWYNYTYTTTNNCEVTVTVLLKIRNGSNSTINETICRGEHILFNGNNYSTEGTYTHTVSSLVNGCDSTITLNLTVNNVPDTDIPSPYATPNIIEIGDSATLSIEDISNASINFNYNWISSDTSLSCTNCDVPTVKPLISTTYYINMVISEINNNCILNISDSVIVTVKEKEFPIDIPEGFSPNKDGTNETFEISNLDKYPLNEIEIYNRWGHKVFKALPYVNNWRGRNYMGISLGDDLPEGTYYYVLQLHDENNTVYRGYIYLKR